MTSSLPMVPSASVSTSPVAPGRLLDQLREQIRYLHYSIRTEQAYVHWVRAFIRFHGLSQWIGWLWPYAAGLWLLGRLGSAPTIRP